MSATSNHEDRRGVGKVGIYELADAHKIKIISCGCGHHSDVLGEQGHFDGTQTYDMNHGQMVHVIGLTRSNHGKRSWIIFRVTHDAERSRYCVGWGNGYSKRRSM